jgi:hypothetical protein
MVMMLQIDMTRYPTIPHLTITISTPMYPIVAYQTYTIYLYIHHEYHGPEPQAEREIPYWSKIVQ